MLKGSKSNRAFSAIISALILILITVSAGTLVYSYTMGWIGNIEPSIPRNGILQVDTITADSSSGTINLYVRNIGTTTLVLDSIYVEGKAVVNKTVPPAVWTPTLLPKKIAYLSIIDQNLIAGRVYGVKVACIGGTSTSVTVIASGSSSSATPTPTATPSPSVTPTTTPTPSTVNVKFRYSGLSNLDTITVLTIDGNEYKANNWELTGQSFIMTIGSTHTVTASTPLTGWDGVTHAFSSWTNGNGLVDASGTFTVPSQDVTVTANYAINSEG